MNNKNRNHSNQSGLAAFKASLLFKIIDWCLIYTMLFLCITVDTLAYSSSIQAAELPASAELTQLIQIGSSTQTAVTRITRTVFDFSYTAQVNNISDQTFNNVRASLASLSPYTTVIDDELKFGTVGPFQNLTSQDTYTIRQDRTFPFDPTKLVWTIKVNSPPLANAGSSQTVAVGTEVTLDGSESSDIDGDTLTTFNWEVLEVPPGSVADLSGPTGAKPTFFVDKPGQYRFQLVVNDGYVDSVPASVVISTSNSPPVADAGPDRHVDLGGTVTLDGSGSTDVDGDRLSYAWSFLEQPQNSTALLFDPAHPTTGSTDTPQPQFVVDLPGTYRIKLIVNDGQVDSAADIVIIGTNNAKPIADAGDPQTVRVGDTVALSGLRSKDPEGLDLIYRWSLAHKPEGSGVDLQNETTAQPSFNVDLFGDYTVQLIVSDGLLDSLPATVGITTENSSPIADVGQDRSTTFGDTVVLDGSASRDPDGDLLTYAWSVLHAPDGSTASITHPTDAQPNFVPDRVGNYVIQLLVRDTHAATSTATFNLTVQPKLNQSPQIISAPPVTGDVGKMIDYQLLATDPDFDTLLHRISAGQVGDMSLSTTGLFHWMPDRAGDFPIELEVSDGRGGIATQAFSVHVIEPVPPPENHAPTITSTPELTATVGLAYTYDVNATDPDAGNMLTYALVLAPTGMDIDESNGIIAWTPNANQSGNQAVTVKTTDQDGLSGTQQFTLNVSETNNPPSAVDDAYEVRVSESLSVPAAGILDNDTDPDRHPLTSRLVKKPSNGTLALNQDGSFSYTPHNLQKGDLVLLENVNLATRVPGVILQPSGDIGHASLVVDDFIGGDTWTGGSNFFEIAFPQAVTVNQLQIFGPRNGTPQTTAGVFRLFDLGGAEIFNSGVVDLPPPNRDLTVTVSNLGGVRRARFTPTAGVAFPNSNSIAELKVIGSALITRENKVADANLAQLLPVKVHTSSSDRFNIPENALDEQLGTAWYATSFLSGEFFELEFPVDITVTGIRTNNPHNGNFFPGVWNQQCSGTFQLFDAANNPLHDSGIVTQPNLAIDFNVPVPNVSGVRRVRWTVSSCANTSFGAVPMGFGEVKVFGSAPVTTPGFSVARKFQALLGRQVHSTPVVANFTDDNADGKMDEHDIPDIVVPVETVGNQLTGEIKVVSGDDGRELFTAGGPQLISPWSEAAVGDIDGDGAPDIIGVHSDGNHLVAFDAAGGSLQGDLTQILAPVTVSASPSNPQYPPPNAVDGNLTTIWKVAAGDSSPVFVIIFSQDVTVTELQLFGGGFQGQSFAAGFFQLLNVDGALLFDTGVVNMTEPEGKTTVSIPNVAGVRRVLFKGTSLVGDGPDISELKVIGSAAAPPDKARVKWTSDANPMPKFLIGNSALIGGAVSIANLDGGERPHIIVGASVFDAQGKLVGDGRTLGGTTGGNGLRSAISAIGDVDLDGAPEIVAGPTAYRLVNGQLTKVWQRADRADGYVGIANFDDDPFAEIVVVAEGQLYMLNHDGTSAEVWNAAGHGPVAIPLDSQGGAGPAAGQAGPPLIADVDGDGLPEIGIATSSNYMLFDRNGALLWRQSIGDHSSHSTGSTAFDFDGDGSVEIVYRDEEFLRIYRGSDGVLLAKIQVRSTTWAELPVVADVDNDGHADIVVSSNSSSATPNNTGVFVIQDVANQWTRTRRIWNQHSYHITNVKENGAIPRVEAPNWLTPGLNNFRLNAFVPGETADQADSFTYKANDGGLDSNEGKVQITLRTPNSAPSITSTPPATAATGVRYLYAVQASDPDAGDVLAFSLPEAPSGMSIDPNFGLIRWTPESGESGLQTVIAKVQDIRGLSALQQYTVQIGNPVTVPNVIGQPLNNATAAVAAAGLATGTLSSQTSPTVLSGTILNQNPAAGALVAPSTEVALVLSLGPPPPGTVPNVVGQPQANAVADLVASGFVEGTTTGQNSTTIAAGAVISQNPAAGATAAIGASIDLLVSQGPPPDGLDQDGDGFTPNQGDCNDTNPSLHPGAVDVIGNGIDENCNGVDSIVGDSAPPDTILASPLENAVITMPTDITGSVGDVNFLRYRLELASVDNDNFTVIGSGTAPVFNAVLGKLDPTLLENGLYRVRLTAEDVNGHTTVDEQTYRVSGEAKVGVFALSFVDLQVPVSGIPISVIRSYDSRVKTQEDFGIGWSLEIKNGKYQNNRKPGLGWIINDLPFLGDFLPCIGGVSETRSHFTQLRLSDREIYTFALSVTNETVGITGACEGKASFRFIDGPTLGATLDILDGTDVIYLRGGNDQVLDMAAFLDGVERVYEPRKVRLTTIDGRKVDFDRSLGITRIEDNNGNALTISPAGIIHSSGKSIRFNRDTQGRITRITDPMGHLLNYGYDANSDLIEFIDQSNNRTTFVYDTPHNLVEIRDPLGDRAFKGEYDSEGQLVAMIDANGKRIAFSHDVPGRQEVVTDARGNITRVNYNDRGDVVSSEQAVTIDGATVPVRTFYEHNAMGDVTVMIDPDGVRSESAYGDQRLLTTVVDPDGLALRTAFTYDSRGNLLDHTDAAGNTTKIAYDIRRNPRLYTDTQGNSTTIENDTQGRPIRSVDALGVITRITYDNTGYVIREEQLDAAGASVNRSDYTYDANGNRLTQTLFRTLDGNLQKLTTTFAYDAKNRLISTTDPSGNISRVEYNTIGKESARIDALGRRTAFTYDAAGALARTNFPDGTFETREYDAAGNLIGQTNQAGHTTTYEYDELKRLVRTVLPDGTSNRTLYSPGGNVTAVIDGQGNRTDFEYDSAGRRTLTRKPQVFDALQSQLVRPETREILDAMGRRTALIDANENRTEFTYDGAHRPLRTTHSDGLFRDRRFDAGGRLIQVIDEAAHLTNFGYDARGRLVRVTDPVGGITTYSYDEMGNQLTQTDALGRTTRFAYDQLGRVMEKVLPGGKRDLFTYDAVGNIFSYTDFNGDRTIFTYDAMNRLVQKTFSDGSNVKYSYTPTGKRSAVTDARGITRYAYDASDRLAKITQPDGQSISYSYDAAGRLQELSSPGGAVTYEYDALGRLARASAASLGAADYGYDAVGNVVQIAGSNGVLSRRDYDSRNRMTQLQHTLAGATLGSFSYELGPTGHRARITESDGSVETYQYDALERLVSEVRTGTNPHSVSYEYDKVSNRTRMVRDGVQTLYQYDANDQLLNAGGNTFSYDNNGNLLSKTMSGSTTSYDWDFDNRLVSAAGSSGATQFTYDADGNRVARQRGGDIARYLVDQNNPTGYSQVIEERDGSGNLSAHNLYGGDLLATSRGVTNSFYHYDALGSTRMITNGDGATTDTYNYDAFGNLAAATGSSANPYLFAGERFEPGVGLYDLRARNYDPLIGRFLARDPFAGKLTDPRSLHAFLYAHADPVNRIDPTGQFSFLLEIASSLGIEILQGVNLVRSGVQFCALAGAVEKIDDVLFIGQLSYMFFALITSTFGELDLFNPSVGIVYSAKKFAPSRTPGKLAKIETQLLIDSTRNPKVKLTFEDNQGVRNGAEINLFYPEKSSIFTGHNKNIFTTTRCGVEVAKGDLTARVKSPPFKVPPIPDVAFGIDITALGVIKYNLPIVSLPSDLQ